MEWVALREINTKNLKVALGEPLPYPWNKPGLRAELKRIYGENCIGLRSLIAQGLRKPVREGTKDVGMV